MKTALLVALAMLGVASAAVNATCINYTPFDFMMSSCNVGTAGAGAYPNSTMTRKAPVSLGWLPALTGSCSRQLL